MRAGTLGQRPHLSLWLSLLLGAISSAPYSPSILFVHCVAPWLKYLPKYVYWVILLPCPSLLGTAHHLLSSGLRHLGGSLGVPYGQRTSPHLPVRQGRLWGMHWEAHLSCPVFFQ